MTTLYDIDKFCDYFEAQVSAIDNLNPSPVTEESITQVRLYKKTLVISAIDTLASLRFSQENYKELNRHKKNRFTRFVSEYGEWEHGALISVPYLFDQLELTSLKDIKLYAFLRNKLSAHDSDNGKILNIDIIDLSADELLDVSNSEIEEHMIFESQHYALLYGYKNCIAHENRKPCGVMEAYQYAKPHYYSYLKTQQPDQLTHWHLSYPVEHFKKVFFCCMKNMKRHFINTSTNPYSLIDESQAHSRWWQI